MPMSDVEQRIKILEDKVKILEETLQTLKNMQLSEQMEGYLKSKTKTLRIVNLLNSVSGEDSIDFSREQESIRKIQSQKDDLDLQIAAAVKEAKSLSENCPDNASYFNYEIESDRATDYDNNDIRIAELTPYVGKGIRITSYNGFDAQRIIVPDEIDGMPVTSIGEKAFMNTTLSEIVLPTTIKVIMKYAFLDCPKLTKIDLPSGLLCISDYAFGNGFRKSDAKIICVFRGKFTKISRMYSSLDKPLHEVKMIYCLPGSNIQKFAREHHIPIRPLSEFQTEGIL